MNKHVNKKRIVVKTEVSGLFSSVTQEIPAPDPNLRLAERDTMPRQVATEMLCTAPMSNRQRKVCMAARSVVHESTREPIPPEQRIEGRLKGATWAQLAKWLRRVTRRRSKTQAALLRAIEMRDNLGEPDKEKEPKKFLQARLLDRAVAALNLKGGQLDIFWDACEREIERRRGFCARLATVSEEVAQKVQQQLCPA